MSEYKNDSGVTLVGATDLGIPRPGMELDPNHTAIVITDPQNDFLSPSGSAWSVVGQSVIDNDTVKHIAQLMQAARDGGFKTFISPHYYYPHDHTWQFEGVLEQIMHKLPMFDRVDQLSVDGFEGSGADWLQEVSFFDQVDLVLRFRYMPRRISQHALGHWRIQLKPYINGELSDNVIIASPHK